MSLEPIRALDLLTDEHHPTISWLWEGMLAAGNVTLLTSVWKAGKSSLLALLLTRRRDGGVWLGRVVEAGPSAVVSAESAAVELKYGKSDFERRHYALLALMCIYGIELLADNIAECRANVLEIFADYLDLDESAELYRAASYVLSQDLVHGDALTMRTHEGQPITFAEWGYLGTGKFQRRDFRLATLAQSSTFSAEGSLFAHLGKHEIFTPERTYPPMTVSELAAALGPASEDRASTPLVDLV